MDGNWAGLKPKRRSLEAGANAVLPGAACPGASTQDREQAARDSVRALMLIRAYRTRGHLAGSAIWIRWASNARRSPELDPA